MIRNKIIHKIKAIPIDSNHIIINVLASAGLKNYYFRNIHKIVHSRRSLKNNPKYRIINKQLCRHFSIRRIKDLLEAGRVNNKRLFECGCTFLIYNEVYFELYN
jgi:hypothetical protein